MDINLKSVFAIQLFKNYYKFFFVHKLMNNYFRSSQLVQSFLQGFKYQMHQYVSLWYILRVSINIHFICAMSIHFKVLGKSLPGKSTGNVPLRCIKRKFINDYIVIIRDKCEKNIESTLFLTLGLFKVRQIKPSSSINRKITGSLKLYQSG